MSMLRISSPSLDPHIPVRVVSREDGAIMGLNCVGKLKSLTSSCSCFGATMKLARFEEDVFTFVLA